MSTTPLEGDVYKHGAASGCESGLRAWRRRRLGYLLNVNIGGAQQTSRPGITYPVRGITALQGRRVGLAGKWWCTCEAS